MTYRQHYNELEKMIKKEFGKKCKDFTFNCYVCQAYLMLQILKDIMEVDEI